MANKVLFLDRDGTINIDYGYVYKIEDFKFIDGVFEFCIEAQKKGYKIIVITNQSGIERGYYTKDDFDICNQYMIDEFFKKGIEILDVFYCPFLEHEDRKPNPGMFEKAIKKYNIDTKESFSVGDKKRDIEAAQKAGISKNYLLENPVDFKNLISFL